MIFRDNRVIQMALNTKNIQALDQIHDIDTNHEIILVVDDSREMVNYMADKILASLGYQSLKAYSGKMALEIIRNYSLWQTETIDSSDVFRASEIEEANQINFWDVVFQKIFAISLQFTA